MTQRKQNLNLRRISVQAPPKKLHGSNSHHIRTSDLGYIARFMKVLFLFDCLLFSCHIYVLIESPLWAWLHFKGLFTQKSMIFQIFCFSNNILTQNHLVPKRLLNDLAIRTAQKMNFSSFLRIWSHFLKKSLMENFIFCAVSGISLSVPLRTRWFVGSHSLQSFYFCFLTALAQLMANINKLKPRNFYYSAIAQNIKMG